MEINMDKPEKDMPEKGNPEKGKAEILKSSDKDKVQKQYSNPNDLQNLLEDIEDYEGWAAGSNMFNSSTADRITPEAPDETPRAKKITKARQNKIARPYRVLNPATGAWEFPPDENGMKPLNPKQKGMGNLPTSLELGNGQANMSANVNSTGLDGPASNWGRPAVPSNKMPATPPGMLNKSNPGMKQIPTEQHHKDTLVKTLGKGINNMIENLFPSKNEPSQKNVTPGDEMGGAKTALLKIIAEDSHPKKDQTGIVDSTIKDIQDDDALASKELDELLKDTDAYMKYLGLSDVDYPNKKSL
jgi:hypothetical protein